MNDLDLDGPEGESPRETITQLEERIERLEAKLEGCRKVAAASQLSIVLGIALLGALLVGLIWFDALPLLAGMALVIGGFVMLGSNSSTARETRAQLDEANMLRAELIGSIPLRVVGGTDTLH